MKRIPLIFAQILIGLFFVIGGFALVLLFLYLRPEEYIISTIHCNFYLVGVVIGTLITNIFRVFSDNNK